MKLPRFYVVCSDEWQMLGGIGLMLSSDKNMKMYAFGTVFLIFFIALSIVSLRVVKYRMFNSSKVMGESVAARFVDREMAKIHT